MSTVDRLQPGHNGSATDRLTEVMQKFVLEPAIPFSASLVLDTMIEQKNGIPLIHQAPWHPFQVPYSGPVFFGAPFDGNPNETEHIHPAQWELYFTVKVRFRV